MKYIYQLLCKDGRRYIGQTSNPSHRRSTHFYDLRQNRHSSKELQKAFNADNGSITFEIICQCKDEDADSLERFYIRKYKTTNKERGFNTSAGRTENGGNQVAEETCRKLSKAKVGNTVMKGRKLSDEWKANLSAAQPHKRRVRCIETGNEYESFADAARKTGLRRTGIVQCCTGKKKTVGGYRFEYAD